MGLWWKDVNVRVISFSTYHFMVEVLDDNNSDMWRAVGIYGWPEKANKYKTWELMKSLKFSSASPIVFFGDFNEIINEREKEGGVPRSERCMDGFRELIDDCSLHDLGYQGSCFTWQRGVTMETLIRERLDRFLACEDWCNLFPTREVRHFPIYCSDHAPIILTAGKETNMWAKKKLFKFELFWLSKPECEEVIRNSWSEELNQPADIKLAKCASVLEEWAATIFGDVKKRIRKNEKLLKRLQRRAMDASVLEQCKKVKLNKDELSLFATLAWAAWTSRNKRIFHHSDHDPRSIAVGFPKYVADYKRYALNVFGARLSLDVRSAAGWNPPPSGVVKVNTDAAVFDGGGVGLGAVVRDEKGGLLAISSKRLGCRWFAAMAEAAAINYGLQLARQLNYMKVWLECDAMELVGK
ncbi:hypothetical protein RDABS01_027142 [Bienertia sinuspersici]